MDTEQYELVIELLKQQLLVKMLHDEEAFEAQIRKSRQAAQMILMQRDGHLYVQIEGTDNISRLNVEVDINVRVTLDEPIPVYLPPDIFIQLHGKSVEEMIAILRGYHMPEKEIKPFLRRIIPADDSL